MNNIKDIKINLSGKEYKLSLTPNAIEKIQDRFNVPISQLGELAKDERQTFRVLRGLLTILINEAIDDSGSGELHVTEDYVGRKVTAADILMLKEQLCAPNKKRSAFPFYIGR